MIRPKEHDVDNKGVQLEDIETAYQRGLTQATQIRDAAIARARGQNVEVAVGRAHDAWGRTVARLLIRADDARAKLRDR
jgi:hypothetical protein